MGFTTLALEDRDFGSPLNEDLIDGLHARDEDLRERVCYLELAEFQRSVTSYPGGADASWQVYIPQAATAFYVAFQAKIQQCTSGEVQCKIGALTSSEVSTSNTAYSTEPVFWCVFSDVSSVVGTEVQLDLRAKYTTATGGTPWIRVQEADGPVSYFTG